jgi:two-component sensor histidine kinase
LQLLSSVLSMQSLYSQQEEKDISLEVENRVQSIVLLDRLLYETNIEGDQIEISQYLNELIIGLSEAYELKRKIEIIKDISPLQIPAEQAKFIGLLVNEMITNSFKYAFPKNENPILEISFLPYEENNYQLILRDNGLGLAENKSNKKTSSLGMKLIDTMSRQLKGKYLIENRNGFYYELVFEVKKGLN